LLRHVKILYDLTELFSSAQIPHQYRKGRIYLLQLVAKAPDNLSAKLSLTDIYIRNGIMTKQLNDWKLFINNFLSSLRKPLIITTKHSHY